MPKKYRASPKTSSSSLFRNLKSSEPRKFMGLKLTAPATLAFIGYIVLALVIILPFQYPVVDERTGKEYVVQYDFVSRIMVLLVMAIPIALSVYSINCMMVGKCVWWSYIVTIIGLYWVALFVILAVLYTFFRKQ